MKSGMIIFVCAWTIYLVYSMWKMRQTVKRFQSDKAKGNKRNAELTFLSPFDAMIKKVTALRNDNKRTDALAVLEHWYAQNPNLPDGDSRLVGYGLLGNYYVNDKRWLEAAPLLVRTLTYYEKPETDRLKFAGSAANTHELLARFYQMQGNREEMQKHYLRAAECWEQKGIRGNAAKNRAHWHMHNGEFRKSANFFKSALSHSPHLPEPNYRPWLLVQRTLALLGAGEFTESLSVAKRVVAANAGDSIGPVAFRVVALAWAKMGYLDEADQFIHRASMEGKTQKDAVHALGVRCLLLHYRGRFSEIITLCTAHIAEASVPQAKIYSYLGLALQALGRFAEAESAFRLALEQPTGAKLMDTVFADALYQRRLASVLVECEKYDEAFVWMEKSAWSASRTRSLYFRVNVTDLYARARRKQEPLDELKAQIERLREELQNEQEQYSEPSDFLRHFADVWVELAQALLYIGDALGGLKVLGIYETDETLLPNGKAQLYYWRGHCYEALGDLENARAAYHTVLQTDVDPESKIMQQAKKRLVELSSLKE